ncbi:hypothetical protein KC901_02355 [Patescibacteria group bacterium]|nr:hypothetical protein [Patescibacteria group bacterium]
MHIRSYLPSKKVRIILLVFVVALIAFLLYRFVVRPHAKGTQGFIDVMPVEDNRSSEYYLDSDHDGAYDWEEALWAELDPNNPDSDGDGVLDGKYIRNKLSLAERERLGDAFVDSHLTETEKLGRSAFTALIAIAQSGGDLDSLTEEQFQDNIGQYISDLTLGDQLYTRDQLNLVEDTKENTYRYRDSMMQLFKTYPIATSDIELMIEATNNPDEYQGRLRSTSKKYNEYLSELASLEVPYVIAGRHTELMNSVSQISAGLDNLLQGADIDELVSLALLVQLESIMNSSVDAIVKINIFFDVISDPSIFEG